MFEKAFSKIDNGIKRKFLKKSEKKKRATVNLIRNNVCQTTLD